MKRRKSKSAGEMNPIHGGVAQRPLPRAGRAPPASLLSTGSRVARRRRPYYLQVTRFHQVSTYLVSASSTSFAENLRCRYDTFGRWQVILIVNGPLILPILQSLPLSAWLIMLDLVHPRGLDTPPLPLIGGHTTWHTAARPMATASQTGSCTCNVQCIH